MGGNKITWVHVSLIGGVVGVIVGVAMFFLMLKPINVKNKSLRADIAQLDSYTAQVDTAKDNIQQIEPAKAALEAAKTRKESEKAQLASLKRRFQLPGSEQVYLPAGDTGAKLKYLPRWLNLGRNVVPKLEAYAKDSGKKLNVNVTTDFAVKAPTTDPDSIPKKIIAWDLGPMTATGRFENVMKWVRGWNQSPLLTSVNGLALTLAGRGGKVTANCELVTYIFPTGPGAGQGGGAVAGGAATPGGVGNTPMEGMPSPKAAPVAPPPNKD